MKNKLSRVWNYWLAQFIYAPGDAEDVMLSKNIWVGVATSAFFLGLTALVVYLFLGLKLLVYLMTGFCAFFLVSMLIFLHIRRQAERFFMAAEIFKMLFAFSVVLITGGILHSGGFVFIGFSGIYLALVFPDFGKVRFLLLLYLTTVMLEALLQSYITPLVQFSDTENLVLFVLYFMVTAITLYFFIRIYNTERNRFRKLEAEKLRALDAAKNHFFANISHEFRTPLTVILGMVDQLRETSFQKADHAANLIQRSGKKLLRLVDQLLNLSMLEAGELPVHYVQDDIVAELKYLLEPFQSLAEAKQISLHFSSKPEFFLMDFDPEKLEHLVGNLLDNALKYTPAGGEVWLQVEHLTNVPPSLVNTLKACPSLFLQVKDTGIGIATQYLGRIFDRFYQVGEWPTEGAGVGLAMVREYVRVLGGHIEVTSQPGEGSVFSIFLPIKNSAVLRNSFTWRHSQKIEQEEEGTPVLDATLVDSRPRLLIIEDNPDVTYYLQNFLQKDYDLKTAFDGEQGIALALEQVPDIIISDIMMPKKDGLEVCRVLKADFRTNHIPIILLTAKTDVDSRVSGLESGADAYLAKPFHRRELEVELKKLMALRETMKQKYSHRISGPQPENPPQGLNERFLYDVQHCLERHYHDEDFGIRELCSMTGVSRTQLHRKLMALTGQPASHFIRSFRLEKARDLLRTTRMTVAEVAYAVGFKDAYYFSRTFSHEFGLSPSEAREV